MTIYDDCQPLGLGTLRLPLSGADDREGFEKSIELVCEALDKGVDYIDSSYSYSSGMAQSVLAEAFRRSGKRAATTLKVIYGTDISADDAYRRALVQLKALGLSSVSDFVCWTIKSYEEFEAIMQPGGIYEGALKLKDEGIIEHICASSHALPEETIRMIESGAFQAITISYSLMNAIRMQPVLDCALAHDVAIIAMNPLGGGLIPKNPDFFKYAELRGDRSGVEAALRSVRAHPAVKIVLTGPSSIQELNENIESLKGDTVDPGERLQHLLTGAGQLTGFCTGCGYCNSCPEEIPIPYLMQKRNALLFMSEDEGSDKKAQKLKENIRLFIEQEDNWIPKTAENPCIRCGLCEKRCTQSLPIIAGIEDIYERAAHSGFTLTHRRERLETLLHGKGYAKVGLYPTGQFSMVLRATYEQLFGEPPFEWVQFNGDPKLWGKPAGGLTVHGPAEIPELRPDIIIISSSRYGAAIYSSIKHYEEEGIPVVKLDTGDEMPWVY